MPQIINPKKFKKPKSVEWTPPTGWQPQEGGMTPQEAVEKLDEYAREMGWEEPKKEGVI